MPLPRVASSGRHPWAGRTGRGSASTMGRSRPTAVPLAFLRRAEGLAQPSCDPSHRPPGADARLRGRTGVQSRPARCWGEGARDHRAELVGADHRRAVGRAGVELDDPRPFPSKSTSLERVHERVRRQRTPSASRIRRTWERLTSMRRPRSSAVSVSRVHSEGLTRWRPTSRSTAAPPADPAVSA